VGCSSSPAGVIEPAGLREEMIAASVLEETTLLSNMVFCQTVSYIPGALKVHPADDSNTYSVWMIRLL
jgi:hypothetical protein